MNVVWLLALCLLQFCFESASATACTAYDDVCQATVVAGTNQLTSLLFLSTECSGSQSLLSTLCINGSDVSQEDVSCVVDKTTDLVKNLKCTLDVALGFYLTSPSCAASRAEVPSYTRVARCYQNLAARQLNENTALLTTGTSGLVGVDSGEDSDLPAGAIPTTQQQCVDELGWFLCGYYNLDANDVDKAQSLAAAQSCANFVFTAIDQVSPSSINLRDIPLFTNASDYGPNFAPYFEACDGIEGVDTLFASYGEENSAFTAVKIQSMFSLLLAIVVASLM